jgi:hypothetical protein
MTVPDPASEFDLLHDADGFGVPFDFSALVLSDFVSTTP